MSEQRTIAAALERAATTARGLRVVEHDGRSLSIPYETLLGEALAVAGALRAAGLAPGDHVALVVPDVREFVRAFFGISVAGLVPVPLCPPSQAGDIPTFTRQSQHILRASRAAAVVTTAEVAPLLAVQALPLAPAVFLIDSLTQGPALPFARAAPTRQHRTPAVHVGLDGGAQRRRAVSREHLCEHAAIGPSLEADGI